MSMLGHVTKLFSNNLACKIFSNVSLTKLIKMLYRAPVGKADISALIR